MRVFTFLRARLLRKSILLRFHERGRLISLMKAVFRMFENLSCLYWASSAKSTCRPSKALASQLMKAWLELPRFSGHLIS